MEEQQKKAGVDQPRPNGEHGAEDVPGEGTTDSGSEAGKEARRRQIDELTHAYERARDELNEAVRTLRAEIAKIDLAEARMKARTWVDENPTLAVFLGIGAGILAGRLMSAALRPEPPTLPERAWRQAGHLAGQAGTYANELAAEIAYNLGRAARSAGEAGEYVAHRGSGFADVVSRRARELGEDVSRAAEHAGKDFSKRASRAGKDISRRAEDVAETLADTASRSVHDLEEAAHDLSKTLKKRSKKARKIAGKRIDRGIDFSESMLNTARTVVAAVVVKKVSDWMKRMR